MLSYDKRILQLLVTVLISFHSVHPLSLVSSSTTTIPRHDVQQTQQQNHQLIGDWEGAKSSLRKSDCCVVSIPKIDSHLKVLQQHFADNGPPDIDLRARIRIRGNDITITTTYEDCLQVRDSVIPIVSEKEGEETKENNVVNDPCTVALEELARGVASFAENESSSSLLDGGSVDVFVRIVCASNYKARDPPFHTDKAQLRGYVTLRGVGTEYMTRPCSPLEYMTLRTFGEGNPTKHLKRAQELEFIVMKGDYYYDALMVEDDDGDNRNHGNHRISSSLVERVWTRARACVHRSPPASGNNDGERRRRVIVSFDLADGDDDREWYQIGTKREWRNGLTQRKSHLVA